MENLVFSVGIGGGALLSMIVISTVPLVLPQVFFLLNTPP